jgi:NADPH-dependent 7-cyano-7-deazaguanine reductase QueF
MTIRTCFNDVLIFVLQKAPLPVCCPVSGNPLAGSTITIAYRPDGIVLPVESLVEIIDEYRNGHVERGVRGMEEMVQDIAHRVHQLVGVRVRVRADLRIKPPFGGDEQVMLVNARGQ